MLEQLFAPFGLERFFSEAYGRECRLFPQSGKTIADTFTWSTLNDILQHHRLEPPRLRMAREGVGVPLDAFTELVERRSGPPYRRVTIVGLNEALRGGATLVVDRVDQLNEAVSALAFDFEAHFHAPAFVNLYASLASVPGFGLHWDDHHVFVIQTEGSKLWKVYRSTRPWPLRRDDEKQLPPTDDPAMEIMLHAGDVLYIPSGWWHDARAEDASLHITVGVQPPTGSDFLQWFADQLLGDERVRKPLPRPDHHGDLTRHGLEIAEAVVARLDGGAAVEEFLEWFDSMQPARLAFALPWTGTERMLPPSNEFSVVLQAPFARIERVENGIRISAVGGRWTFGPGAEPLLRAIQASRSVSFLELVERAGASEEEVREALGVLLRAGIVTLKVST